MKSKATQILLRSRLLGTVVPDDEEENVQVDCELATYQEKRLRITRVSVCFLTGKAFSPGNREKGELWLPIEFSFLGWVSSFS